MELQKINRKIDYTALELVNLAKLKSLIVYLEHEILLCKDYTRTIAIKKQLFYLRSWSNKSRNSTDIIRSFDEIFIVFRVNYSYSDFQKCGKLYPLSKGFRRMNGDILDYLISGHYTDITLGDTTVQLILHELSCKHELDTPWLKLLVDNRERFIKNVISELGPVNVEKLMNDAIHGTKPFMGFGTHLGGISEDIFKVRQCLWSNRHDLGYFSENVVGSDLVLVRQQAKLQKLYIEVEKTHALTILKQNLDKASSDQVVLFQREIFPSYSMVPTLNGALVKFFGKVTTAELSDVLPATNTDLGANLNFTTKPFSAKTWLDRDLLMKYENIYTVLCQVDGKTFKRFLESEDLSLFVLTDVHVQEIKDRVNTRAAIHQEKQELSRANELRKAELLAADLEKERDPDDAPLPKSKPKKKKLKKASNEMDFSDVTIFLPYQVHHNFALYSILLPHATTVKSLNDYFSKFKVQKGGSANGQNSWKLKHKLPNNSTDS
jgi:hypothetical protein